MPSLLPCPLRVSLRRVTRDACEQESVLTPPMRAVCCALLPTRRQLERMMTRYNVPTAYIDGRVVAGLASDEINAAKLSNVQLLECVANVDQVTPDPILFCMRLHSPVCGAVFHAYREYPRCSAVLAAL